MGTHGNSSGWGCISRMLHTGVEEEYQFFTADSLRTRWKDWAWVKEGVLVKFRFGGTCGKGRDQRVQYRAIHVEALGENETLNSSQTPVLKLQEALGENETLTLSQTATHFGALGENKTICADQLLQGSTNFGWREVKALLGDTKPEDLLVAYIIYREMLRLVKRRTKQLPDDVTKEVEERLKDSDKLPERLRPKILAALKKRFKPLALTLKGCGKNREAQSLPEIVRKTHFINVFHYHDGHNKELRRLHKNVPLQSKVAVAAIAYFTGDRTFVARLVRLAGDAAVSGTVAPHCNLLAFARHAVLEHLHDLSYEGEGVFPSLFHRRFRPCLLWDNRWRRIMSYGLEGMSLQEVKQELLNLALKCIQTYALPVACQKDICDARSYRRKLYTVISRYMHKGSSEKGFHSKNLANSLEPFFFKAAWYETKESVCNGLGPGFRQFAHIRQGYGKRKDILNTKQLDRELDYITKYVRDRWPWSSEVRKRHVQAVCCEVQKLLFVLKYGRPASTFSRRTAQITMTSLAGLVAKKRPASKRGSPGRPGRPRGSNKAKKVHQIRRKSTSLDEESRKADTRASGGLEKSIEIYVRGSSQKLFDGVGYICFG
ncbi:unnamed protein product [Effrenium voratum]|uniref:Uncharacterized protein n=1 Tax=Effrenium voratum TaxID=2562239 RepID=A0AA36IMZ9_9DINO|nr:unnamed protein product [Effrenium voratum]